jgi:hypothetical protein
MTCNYIYIHPAYPHAINQLADEKIFLPLRFFHPSAHC